MKKNEEFSRKPAHFLKSACLALCLVVMEDLLSTRFNLCGTNHIDCPHEQPDCERCIQLHRKKQ